MNRRTPGIAALVGHETLPLRRQMVRCCDESRLHRVRRVGGLPPDGYVDLLVHGQYLLSIQWRIIDLVLCPYIDSIAISCTEVWSCRYL